MNEKLQTAIRLKSGAHARQRRFGDHGLSVQESGRSFVIKNYIVSCNRGFQATFEG